MFQNQIVSGVISLVLPWIIEIVKTKFPNNKKVAYAVSLLLSIVVGFLATVIEGKFDTTNLLSSISASFVVSQSVYNLYFKGSDSERKIVETLAPDRLEK